MNTLLPAFLVVCLFAINGVEGMSCISCDEQRINNTLVTNVTCADGASQECSETVTSCTTLCYKITGTKAGAAMELVVTQSGCDMKAEGVIVPDSGCATIVTETSDAPAVETWEDKKVVYSNVCGCKGDDCNTAVHMATCSTHKEEDPCIDGKVCANGGTCGGTADEPKCDCAYSYTGDLCEDEYTTGSVCVRSCATKANGAYQSCTTCEKFVNCTSEVLAEVACPANQKWDNDKVACANTTATCELKTSGSSKITFTVFSLLILAVFYMGK